MLFSKVGDNAFTVAGFSNRMKAQEKIKQLMHCTSHKEAVIKWSRVKKKSIKLTFYSLY